jgi:hypothetical protein
VAVGRPKATRNHHALTPEWEPWGSAQGYPSATRCHAFTVIGLSPVSRFSFMFPRGRFLRKRPGGVQPARRSTPTGECSRHKAPGLRVRWDKAQPRGVVCRWV